MTERIFTILENNPSALNQLGYALGLSQNAAFYDVYSLTDQTLLSFIPRPAYALLAIIPMTKSWNEDRISEDANINDYSKSGPDEPVLWFKQIILEGCGSVGLLHCALNSASEAPLILPGSELERLRNDAIPLKMAERAQLLADSDILFEAHQTAAKLGDTEPPAPVKDAGLGQHFVAYVKGKDGHLYELEGSRKGPLDRGLLEPDEDVLSERALRMGLGRVIELEAVRGGDLRFSCTALAPSYA